MFYALVHYPKIDIHPINQLRRKYDPQFKLIDPHITLMFPVADSICEADLVHQIESALEGWHSFPIHLRGLQIAPDNHLFLLVKEGNTKIIRLYEEIHTGVLAGHKRDEVPYVPHLTLGIIDRDPDDQKRILKEARQLNLDHHCVMDRVDLLKVTDDRSRILGNTEFTLNN